MCLSCSALMAEPVSKQKALQVASQVMGTKNGMRMAPAMNMMKAVAAMNLTKGAAAMKVKISHVIAMTKSRILPRPHLSPRIPIKASRSALK